MHFRMCPGSTYSKLKPFAMLRANPETTRMRHTWTKLPTLLLVLVFIASMGLFNSTQLFGQQNPPAGQKMIKDPAEYNAYIAALNTQDPAQRANAMEAFVAQYPGSVVKTDALEQAMAAYQQAGNVAKLTSTANHILALDPDNVRALAIVTFLNRALASQGDAKATADVRTDSEKGLKALPGWQKPDGTSDADFEKMRMQMAAIFHGAAGFAALQAKDYPAARDQYMQSIEIDPRNLQDVYQLAVAELEMKPLDPTGFWYVAKAFQLAQGNAAAQKSIADYGKAKYRRYHGGEDGWDQLVAAVANQPGRPADFSVKPAPTPAEIAVKAVQENSPGDLSFGDYEFVLSFRDASPANKEAAVKVMQSILEKEKQGAAKLKLQVKVISATQGTIQAAITDENRLANKADLQVTMTKPMLRPPAAGAMIDIIGVITEYVPSPFTFIMKEGEVVKPASAVHAKP
jgi:tetratricopeptide (TPR) repeat protein